MVRECDLEASKGGVVSLARSVYSALGLQLLTDAAASLGAVVLRLRRSCLL